MVKRLISSGANTNPPITVASNTPLILSIMYGLVDSSKLLIDSGVDVNQETQCGRTPITCAVLGPVIDKNIMIIQHLLKHGADINKPRSSDGATALICAISRATLHATSSATSSATPDDNKKIIYYLLEKGADPNKADKNGETPLVWGERKGYSISANFIRSWIAELPLRNQITVKLCISTLKAQRAHEALKDTPTNELTKEQFVFKVLEEMRSRCMYGLADGLVEYVG